MQGSWGLHGTHLGLTGPRWAPCWPHEPCYQGSYIEYIKKLNFLIPWSIIRDIMYDMSSNIGDRWHYSLQNTVHIPPSHSRYGMSFMNILKENECHLMLSYWGWNQNGHYFADNILKCISPNEKFLNFDWNFTRFKFVPNGPVFQINFWYWTFNSLRPSVAYMLHQPRPSLVLIMACHLASSKPLSQPIFEHC